MNSYKINKHHKKVDLETHPDMHEFNDENIDFKILFYNE